MQLPCKYVQALLVSHITIQISLLLQFKYHGDALSPLTEIYNLPPFVISLVIVAPDNESSPSVVIFVTPRILLSAQDSVPLQIS